ncbi:helix-turn-helix domain-containing protein [Pseudomonas cichorii]|uniref:HTH cro/C1-type domain-containing protein n=1 Tax=Pseudomonas cichorii TaxID=36746 RepID=A0A3M4VEW0_PSECI|nr:MULTISPECIES: helix-turn-helix domain-containing protein [Pseudomonas]AHF68996.1 hypothetical protein PCH70_38430 [Pseudomonas cichorii JBC1]MBX8490148.1 helix-turn-helix domain-containing protein [Pseudomonas cichorii]MBX8509664.1 helix-turn-helix domain-containing protein [Pseudomonas cichorii]MBX8524859.1 helix-turn-helix domain-containing protein [Pseudomonas cichorii]MBX8533368.1 helix-turn-helix domain-containing protein [Pseudomonas cichorii]
MQTISMTDDAIAAVIGERIEAIRLKRNIHQDVVAHEAGISRETYRKIASGKGTLVNVIAVLRALGELDRLSSMIAEVRASPIQMAKMQGKQRMRAAYSKAEKPTAALRKTTIDKPKLIGNPDVKKDLGW